MAAPVVDAPRDRDDTVFILGEGFDLGAVQELDAGIRRRVGESTGSM